MAFPWSAIVLVIVTALAVTAMLLVRRRAPEGGYFADCDRAAGVFGVIATGFSVLLGLIIFLAFTSYDSSRAGAEAEALIVAQQVETAQFLPQAASTRLTGELVCYARWVAGPGWEQMTEGTLGERPNPWAVAMFETLQRVEPETAAEQAAYGKWLDQTSDREAARHDRIHGGAGVLPTPLWVVLFFVSGVIFVFMLFFADSAERAVTQALMMGSVVAVIASLLLLLQVLDNPFGPGAGSLRPAAMERTLVIIDEQLAITSADEPVPCDAHGLAAKSAGQPS
jgi:amino acid transporter